MVGAQAWRARLGVRRFMADNNDALFNEIEEELRRERYAKLWQQYGNFILAGAALIVATVGGFKYWESQKIAAAQSAGAEYQAALAAAASGKTDEARKAFDAIAKDGPKGYQTLARLQLAGVHIRNGETAEAQKLLSAVADDTSASSILRDYAKLQTVSLNVGDADFTEVKNRLNDLTAEGNPWRVNALEMLALAALDGGKFEDARELFRSILASTDAPAGTVSRANEMLALIASRELQQKTAAASDAGGQGVKENGEPAAAEAAPEVAPEGAVSAPSEMSGPEGEKKE